MYTYTLDEYVTQFCHLKERWNLQEINLKMVKKEKILLIYMKTPKQKAAMVGHLTKKKKHHKNKTVRGC